METIRQHQQGGRLHQVAFQHVATEGQEFATCQLVPSARIKEVRGCKIPNYILTNKTAKNTQRSIRNNLAYRASAMVSCYLLTPAMNLTLLM